MTTAKGITDQTQVITAAEGITERARAMTAAEDFTRQTHYFFYKPDSVSLQTSDLAEVPEETDAHGSLVGPTRKRCDSDSVFTSPENGTEHFHTEQKKREDSPAKRQQHKDLLQRNTYAALFKFVPQDNEDLEMRPGDSIILLDDSNEDWWKGTIEDRVGYFPANFAHQVKAGEIVYRCTRTFIGCKEQGQIILKEGQICVANKEETNGFIKVSSGKKKGFVPFDVLENV
ncbi:UNVERIFIED_CONTAM: hypothetical protein FKN15_042536 [Acipenser sinensis]